MCGPTWTWLSLLGIVAFYHLIYAAHAVSGTLSDNNNTRRQVAWKTSCSQDPPSENAHTLTQYIAASRLNTKHLYSWTQRTAVWKYARAVDDDTCYPSFTSNVLAIQNTSSVNGEPILQVSLPYHHRWGTEKEFLHKQFVEAECLEKLVAVPDARIEILVPATTQIQSSHIRKYLLTSAIKWKLKNVGEVLFIDNDVSFFDSSDMTFAAQAGDFHLLEKMVTIKPYSPVSDYFRRSLMSKLLEKCDPPHRTLSVFQARGLLFPIHLNYAAMYGRNLALEYLLVLLVQEQTKEKVEARLLTLLFIAIKHGKAHTASMLLDDYNLRNPPRHPLKLLIPAAKMSGSPVSSDVYFRGQPISYETYLIKAALWSNDTKTFRVVYDCLSGRVKNNLDDLLMDGLKVALQQGYPGIIAVLLDEHIHNIPQPQSHMLVQIALKSPSVPAFIEFVKRFKKQHDFNQDVKSALLNSSMDIVRALLKEIRGTTRSIKPDETLDAIRNFPVDVLDITLAWIIDHTKGCTKHDIQIMSEEINRRFKPGEARFLQRTLRGIKPVNDGCCSDCTIQ